MVTLEKQNRHSEEDGKDKEKQNDRTGMAENSHRFTLHKFLSLQDQVISSRYYDRTNDRHYKERERIMRGRERQRMREKAIDRLIFCLFRQGREPHGTFEQRC